MLLPWGVYCLRGVSCLLGVYPGGEKRVLQDMICRPLLFIFLKGRGTSYLAQGISYLVGGIYVTNILLLNYFIIIQNLLVCIS